MYFLGLPDNDEKARGARMISLWQVVLEGSKVAAAFGSKITLMEHTKVPECQTDFHGSFQLL